jgi:hypothetical protein
MTDSKISELFFPKASGPVNTHPGPDFIPVKEPEPEPEAEA